MCQGETAVEDVVLENRSDRGGRDVAGQNNDSEVQHEVLEGDALEGSIRQEALRSDIAKAIGQSYAWAIERPSTVSL